jgi:prephenate dehydratase
MTADVKTPARETIAFQGKEGAHADLACRSHYPYMHTHACSTFDDVFELVDQGKVALGLIPIENSQAGRVAEIHQILPRTNLHIVGEHFQKIEHHLIAPKGTKLSDINTVYSHPQALMQCREHLRDMNLLGESYSNTAMAAADVAKWNDPGKAALASRLAAELYGLEVVQPDMQDSNENVTVFAALSKEPKEIPATEEKVLTTVIFTVRNIPAALYKALGGFATNSVNMIKLESYIPGGTSSTAQFYITLEGNPQSRNVQLALEELGFFCRKVQVLGVYPADPARFEPALLDA